LLRDAGEALEKSERDAKTDKGMAEVAWIGARPTGWIQSSQKHSRTTMTTIDGKSAVRSPFPLPAIAPPPVAAAT
jgi:hypothetical protein